MSAKRLPLNFSQYVANNKALEKKVPDNPKYKHVRPAVDSGKNVRTLINILKEKRKNATYGKDETFKRIKLSAFVRLAITVATDFFPVEPFKDENASACGDGVPEPNSSKPERKEPHVVQSAFCSVLMGMGEIDLQNEKRKPSTALSSKPEIAMPYLLLDVRDRDDYSQCHIITAKHYPSAMLSRSVGFETKELQLHRNAIDSIIILYDEDELVSIRVARTLIERGYDNVYVLSGGLKLAVEKFPKGLIGGNLPALKKHKLGAMQTFSHSGPIREKFTQEDLTILQQSLDGHIFINKSHDVASSYKSHASAHKPSSENFANKSNANCSEKSSFVSSRCAKHEYTDTQKSYDGKPLRTVAHNTRPGKIHPSKIPPWK